MEQTPVSHYRAKGIFVVACSKVRERKKMQQYFCSTFRCLSTNCIHSEQNRIPERNIFNEKCWIIVARRSQFFYYINTTILSMLKLKSSVTLTVHVVPCSTLRLVPSTPYNPVVNRNINKLILILSRNEFFLLSDSFSLA